MSDDLDITDDLFRPTTEDDFSGIDLGRATIDRAPTVRDDDPTPEKKPRPNTAKWGPKASHPTQFSTFPDTVRRSKVETIVINPHDPAQLDRWNDLQVRAMGRNPEVLIANQDRQFFQGQWMIMADVTTLEYQQI